MAGDDVGEGIKSLEGVARAPMLRSVGDSSENKRGAWQRVTDPMPKILAPVDRSDSGDPCGGLSAKGDGSCKKMFADVERFFLRKFSKICLFMNKV